MIRDSPTGTEIGHEMPHVSPDSNRALSNTRHSRFNLVTVNKLMISEAQKVQVVWNVDCVVK
jgi:hypothetical protein